MVCPAASCPQMDFIIIDHGHHLEPRKAMELAFTVWAVGSCVAGFSDAFISTVAYSQAASIGQRYTHVGDICTGSPAPCVCALFCWHRECCQLGLLL